MNELSFFHPTRPAYRYTILFFVSLLTFGSYFAYDSIGAIANILIRALAMKPSTIGSLYSAYSFAAILIVLIAGIVVDRLGTRTSSLLFSFLVLLGAIIVAMAKSTPILFLGRFVFGAGSESLVVAQLAILSKWFKGRELAMSFGVALTISRLGTLISFNTEAQIAERFHDFRLALWVAALLCLLSLLGNLVYIWMDRHGEKVLGKMADGSGDKFVFSDIRSFPPSYWYVTMLCLTFYSAIFPFTALSTNLFADKWKIPDIQLQGGGFFYQIYHQFILLFRDPPRLAIMVFALLILIVVRWNARKQGPAKQHGLWTFIPAAVVAAVILLPGFSSLFSTAPGMTSVIIFASMICAPFAGGLVDRIGHRASLMVVGCLVMIPSHLLMGVSHIMPAFPMIFLGVAFVLVPAALWPAISLLVPKEKVGTAFGLTTMIQNIGLMLFPWLNGRLRGVTHSYTASQVMFAGLGLVGLVFAFLLLRSDRKAGAILEKP